MNNFRRVIQDNYLFKISISGGTPAFTIVE